MRRWLVLGLVIASSVGLVVLPVDQARASHGTANQNFTAGPDKVRSANNLSNQTYIANPRAIMGYDTGATGTNKQVHWYRALQTDIGSCYAYDYPIIRLRSMTGGTAGAWQYPFSQNTYNGAFCNSSNWGWISSSFAWDGAAEYYEFQVTDCGSSPCTPTKTYLTGDTRVPPPVPAKPVISSSSTAPAGKVLNYDMGAALLLDAGFTVEQAKVGTAVMNGESSFRTKAISYTGCCHGLMQVNTEVHPYTVTQMQDPYQNVSAAKTIYEAAGSWQPWQAYTGPDGSGSDGPWLSYKSAAVDAVERQIACGRCALKDIANAPSSGSASVTFGWTISGSGSQLPDGYHVDRRRSGGSWSRIGEPGAAALKFTDTAATAGDAYEYRLRGWNANGSGEWSDVLTITAAAADPGGSNQLPGDYDGDGIADGPSGGGASDPESDGSVSCGFNMFCWIKAALKWAFVPGEETKVAWNNFYATITSRPPGSWAVNGFLIITRVRDTLESDVQGGESGALAGDACTGGFGGPVGDGVPAPGSGNDAFGMPSMCVSTFVDTIATANWVHIVRDALGLLVYGGAAFAIWRRARNSVGDEASDQDADGSLG